jgi:hypothetical protein
MPKIFALLALLALPARQAKEAQDDGMELLWTVQPEDRYDLKWTYAEERRREPGTGGVDESYDRREILAEVAVKEGAIPGQLAITLKKVTWSMGTSDWDVSLGYAEGKPPAAVPKVKKIDPKKFGQQGGDTKPLIQAAEAAAKTQSEQMAASLKKLFEGDYVLDTTRKGETLILHNGIPHKNGASLFDKVFLHTTLPKGTLKNGQNWKEDVGVLPVPAAGLIDVKAVDYKITLNAQGCTARTGFQYPIVRPPTVSEQKISGNYTYAREYTFGREGYLGSSKEDTSFTKKVDATGNFAKFYEETSSHLIKQAFTLKKRAPPKAPEEKKPAEKK